MPAAHKTGAPPIAVLITGDPVDGAKAHYPTYAHMFEAALDGRATRHVDTREERAFEALDARDFGGVLITGSAAHVQDREPWVLRTEAWLRDAVQTGTPILGVCFGHQLLGQALGGRVDANPRGLELSTVDIETEGTDPLLEGLAPRFLANACHSDTVIELPPGATALAHSTLDPHQCVRFADRCYGVQFHPEFDPPVMKATIAARHDMLVAKGDDPAAYQAKNRPTPEGPRLIQRFVRLFVEG